jgi:hypothetical protein
MTAKAFILAVSFSFAQEEWVKETRQGQPLQASEVLDDRPRRLLRVLGSDSYDARKTAEEAIGALPAAEIGRVLFWGLQYKDPAIRDASRRAFKEIIACRKCHGTGDYYSVDAESHLNCWSCYSSGDSRNVTKPYWWPEW